MSEKPRNIIEVIREIAANATTTTHAPGSLPMHSVVLMQEARERRRKEKQ